MPAAIASNTRYNDQTFSDLSLTNSGLESSSFYECDFVDCSLAETVFHSCRFVDCNFEGCDLSLIQIPSSVFSGVSFVASRLIGIDWTQVDWSAISLGDPVKFNKCVINHSTFIGLKLPGIKITGTTAKNVDFREVDLSGADFTGTDLTDTLFTNTNLSGADLTKARNYAIAAGQNTIKGAKFSLPEALSLLFNLDIELVNESGELEDYPVTAL
jgi:fluoroquinolone resistance protein